MKKTTQFNVKGMHCASCVAQIEGGFKKLKGVSDARVNFAFEKGHVEHDGSVSGDDVVAAVAQVGYTAEIVSGELAHADHDTASDSHAGHAQAETDSMLLARKRRMVFAGVAAVAAVAVRSVSGEVPLAGECGRQTSTQSLCCRPADPRTRDRMSTARPGPAPHRTDDRKSGRGSHSPRRTPQRSNPDGSGT